MGDYITTLEAHVANLKEQMASMQAEKDKKILALESEFKALSLGTQATAPPYVHLPACQRMTSLTDQGARQHQVYQLAQASC